MRSINHVIDPNRLHFVWQSSSPEIRTRFIVGDIVRCGVGAVLSYHQFSPDFLYAVQAGFQGHPAFDYRIPVHHYNVLEIFMKRLPPRNRSDFPYFLQKHGLQSNRFISDFALLGYTGCKLPGDGFSVEIDFEFENPPYEFLMEIAGFQYHYGMQLERDHLMAMPMTFEREPTNTHDGNAIKIMAGQILIGYVPRPFCNFISNWIDRGTIIALVDRIDGQISKPTVKLMVSIYGANNVALLPDNRRRAQF
jgi:hypothetical protein